MKNIKLETVRSAVIHLKEGNAALLPTDTVYGLGACAYDKEAILKVYTLKGRPIEKMLPLHYASIELIARDCEINENFKKLAQNFWPGPLTIVLNKKPDSKLDKELWPKSVAVRIPKHPQLLEILERIKEPIAMPSANKHSAQPAKNWQEATTAFPEIKILKGDCTYSEASTIIDLINEPKIIRPGPISFDEIKDLL